MLPEFQGSGYGKKMMQFYFDLIKNKSKSALFTHEQNVRAISFYENLGYGITKKIPNKYGDGAVRLLMEKIIAVHEKT